ncbi:hypothetical protein [Vibrio comitans]|nr:hypothetical protein [Vibrio comitans]
MKTIQLKDLVRLKRKRKRIITERQYSAMIKELCQKLKCLRLSQAVMQ